MSQMLLICEDADDFFEYQRLDEDVIPYDRLVVLSESGDIEELIKYELLVHPFYSHIVYYSNCKAYFSSSLFQDDVINWLKLKRTTIKHSKFGI